MFESKLVGMNSNETPYSEDLPRNEKYRPSIVTDPTHNNPEDIETKHLNIRSSPRDAGK